MTTIGDNAFYGCGLTSVELPAWVTSIGAGAFDSCSSLQRIEVDSSNNDYSSDDKGVLFDHDKTELIKYPSASTAAAYSIPDSVTTVGKNAFQSCGNLKEVTLGTGITSLGGGAFDGCSGMKVTVNCKVGSEFMMGNTAIEEVVIGDGVTEIGERAFMGCTNLAKVTIGDGVGSIGSQAFATCGSLTDITIGKKVSSVGESAFSGIAAENVEATVNCSNIPAGLFANIGGLKKVTLGSTVGSIGDYAFRATGISEIVIPAGVTSIGRDAFAGNSLLGKVTFDSPATLSGDVAPLQINEGAFSGTGITEISIPDRVTSIGAGAFAGCNSLRSISFGTGIQTVADNAFSKVSFPHNAPTLFYKGDGTSRLSLPSDLEEFRGRTFTGDIERMVREESYTLTFDPDNGTEPWTVTLRPGAGINKPTEPVKTGYDLQYWMKADGTEFDFATEVMPSEDMTLKALWKPMTFTVTYCNGSEPVRTESCAYGSTLALPGEESWISSPGHTLSGWQIAGEGDVYKPGTAYTVVSDIAFTAVWTLAGYSVTFYDGSELIRTESCAYGDGMTLPGEEIGISKPGYALSGWRISGEDEVYKPGTMYTVLSDIAFTAVWEAVPSPQPSWTDDEDGYVPIVTPSYDDSKDTGSDASVTAVAIAAGCAAVLALLTALVYAPKR